MPVEATTVSEGPALGSAVFGAMAAGLYPTLEEAEKRMMLKERVLYTPDLEHADAYERIYRRSRNYHDLLGNMEQPR
jgi:L-ribulokinase